MAPSYTTIPEDEEKLLSTQGSEDGSLPDAVRRLFWKSSTSNTTSFSTVLHWIAHGATILLLSILIFRESSTGVPASARDERELYTPAYGDMKKPLHFE
jgi:hypothetical protein